VLEPGTDEAADDDQVGVKTIALGACLGGLNASVAMTGRKSTLTTRHGALSPRV